MSENRHQDSAEGASLAAVKRDLEDIRLLLTGSGLGKEMVDGLIDVYLAWVEETDG